MPSFAEVRCSHGARFTAASAAWPMVPAPAA